MFASSLPYQLDIYQEIVDSVQSKLIRVPVKTVIFPIKSVSDSVDINCQPLCHPAITWTVLQGKGARAPWPAPRGEQQQTIKGWICKNSSRDNRSAQWVGNHCTMPSTIRVQCSAFLLHCRVRIIEKITSIIIIAQNILHFLFKHNVHIVRATMDSEVSH